jgi:hypothetical protein
VILAGETQNTVISYSASGGANHFFTLTSGSLEVGNITIEHNTNSKGSFIFLNGAGQITLGAGTRVRGTGSVHSLIYGLIGKIYVSNIEFGNISLALNTTAGSISGSLFSIGNVEIISISNVTLQNCTSLSPNSILIDDRFGNSSSVSTIVILSSNFTFLSSTLRGSVIRVTSSSSNVLSVINSIFKNLSFAVGTTVNGGIFYCGNASSVIILSSTFSYVSGANSGGCIVLGTVGVNFINESIFTNCNSSGNGGAILYQAGSVVNISYSTFEGCKSVNGNGGAISTSSTTSGIRKISYCQFIGNSALNGIGSYIYDNSATIGAASVSYYTNSTVSYSNSTSTGQLFVVLLSSALLRFDCLILTNCSSDLNVYLSSGGYDVGVCGNSVQPCAPF